MSNGWVILDKPSGMTSRKAGGRIARMFGANTFGHIGTLDPMASGLLPIALGEATKMIPFMEGEHKKEYLFGVQFGFETDTLDITGKVIKQDNSSFVIRNSYLSDACARLTGEIEQVPPQYSAVHVGGRRAHDLARRGTAFEIPPRKVTIYELRVTSYESNRAEFIVRCSPGTYVRSLARDIAKLCGTVATVDMIHRTKTSGFEIKDAAALDFLENMYNNAESFEEYLKPVDFGLGDIPVWNMDKNDAKLFQNGGFIVTSDQLSVTSGLYRAYLDDEFLGIGFIENGLLKPKRVIVA